MTVVTWWTEAIPAFDLGYDLHLDLDRAGALCFFLACVANSSDSLFVGL